LPRGIWTKSIVVSYLKIDLVRDRNAAATAVEKWGDSHTAFPNITRSFFDLGIWIFDKLKE